MSSDEDLIRRARALREAHNVGVYDVAGQIGVSGRTLLAWEERPGEFLWREPGPAARRWVVILRALAGGH